MIYIIRVGCASGLLFINNSFYSVMLGLTVYKTRFVGQSGLQFSVFLNPVQLVIPSA